MNYYDFLEECVDSRLEMYRKAEKGVADDPEVTTSGVTSHREDIFYFLFSAKDPETNQEAYSKQELLAEANLLMIAGSDTSVTVLCGLFFYLGKCPNVYGNLVSEIRSTFSSVEEIEQGPKLGSCKYLRACINEALRLIPPEPSELEREVRAGGYSIDGCFYPEGTGVGIAHWAYYRNEDIYESPTVFLPERWIESETNSLEDIDQLKRHFTPFIRGVGNCVGQNFAMLQMEHIVARTLWRLDCRMDCAGDNHGRRR